MPTPKPPYNSDDVRSLGHLTADADLSAAQYRLVKATSTGVALCGAGENPLGVLQNAPASGSYAQVATLQGQEMTVVAGGAIAQGASVKAASSGKVSTASSGNEALGTALLAASGDGALLVIHPNRHTVA